MSASTWRDDDEALYQHLMDRRRLEVLWASEGVDGPPPHPRAGHMIAMLRETPEGARAAALADEGDASAMRALVGAEPVADRRPGLLHHLALYRERLARQRGHVADWQSALAAWAALGQKPEYLRRLANAVAGDALSTEEKARWVANAPWLAWDRLVATGVEGAPNRSLEASVALQVLADVRPMAERAALTEEESEALARRAKDARARILDAALAPIEEALDEAEGHEAGATHLTSLEALVHLWRWAGKPPQVEDFYVDRALSIGWELYKAKKFVSLRRLGNAARPLLDAFATRIGTDPRAISYASAVAQFLVFRAEMEPVFERQLEAAERAVEVCDTHRNGRLILADLLAERALRRLEGAPLLGRAAHVERARADVRRARSLWSESLPRLEQAENAVARERKR